MEINSFSIIGKEHKICQDYATSGLDPFPYIIISDGCSSGIDTDVGSRILVQMAKKNINLLNFNYEKFIETVIVQSKAITSLLGLAKESLLATLFIAINVENKLKILTIGDGAIFYSINNKITLIEYEYENNIPFYPIYLKKILDNKNNLLIKNGTETIIKEFSHINYLEIDLSEVFVDWIMLSTDGIKSITNGSEIKDVFKEIVDFKSLKGDFIERKMKRVHKNFLKDGYQNDDDWTMAGISFGD